MAELTATNNGDGTVTVRVAGGNPGDVVSVYGGPSVLSFGANFFGAINVIGDGTGSDTYAVGTTGVTVFVGIVGGVPVGFASVYVETTGDSIAAAFRVEIATRIASLNLFADVQRQMFPDLTDLDMPGCILTPWGMAESDEGSLAMTDDTGFPTRVIMVDREDKLDHPLLQTYEYRRQVISEEFRSQQLNTRQESFICRVEFGTIIDTVEHPEYLVSELVIRAVGRESRNNY